MNEDDSPCFLCDREVMMADTESWDNPLCDACFESLGEPKKEPDWSFVWGIHMMRDEEE